MKVYMNVIHRIYKTSEINVSCYTLDQCRRIKFSSFKLLNKEGLRAEIEFASKHSWYPHDTINEMVEYLEDLE